MKYALILFMVVTALMYSLNELFFSKERNVIENKTDKSTPHNSSNGLTQLVKTNKIKIVTVKDPNEPIARVNAAIVAVQRISAEEIDTDNVEDTNIVQAKNHLPFKDQEVDYNWAPEFTDKLYDVFSSDEELTKLIVKEIECRATLCYLQFYVENADSIKQAQIVGKVLTSGDWQEHSFYLLGHPEPGVMTIQIGRFKEN